METYKLQPRDFMRIRITNAYVIPNRFDEFGNITSQMRNFAGRPTNVNSRGGYRTIKIDLNKKGNADYPFLIEFGNDDIGWRPVTVEDVVNMGWQVDFFDARKDPRYTTKDDYVPSATIEVVVKEHDFEHRKYDPKVFMYSGSNTFSMVFRPDPSDQNQLPIDILDKKWFDRVQVCLAHSEKNKAYLEFMHVYVKSQERNYADWTR